jgi:CBS domain containing-hemolysin-like protein
VAGLVLTTLHRIPRTGEEFQIRGYTITVLDADARHVGAVKITPLAPAAAAGAA